MQSVLLPLVCSHLHISFMNFALGYLLRKEIKGGLDATEKAARKLPSPGEMVKSQTNGMCKTHIYVIGL